MRTTINLDDDIAAAIRRLQQERGLGVSEAVNQLARAGLRSRPRRSAYRHRSARIGLTIDVSNVAEVLEVLDGPAR